MEATKSLSWDDFRKKVFTDAMQIVQNSRCSTFKLMGYKHLDIRLILYFDDCHQVYDFEKLEDEIRTTKFFTKDQDHEGMMAGLKLWKEEIERDVDEKTETSATEPVKNTEQPFDGC